MRHGIDHWDPEECYGCKLKTLQLRPGTAFRPHMNATLGRHVETERDFQDGLKRAADANSIATGTEHRYEMIDPADLRRQEPTSDTNVIETSASMRSKLGV